MKYLRSLLIVLVGLVLGGNRKQAQSSVSKDGYVDVNEEVATPADLSKNGWKAALKNTKQALKDKQLGMLAAGLAYYTTLTFFPAMLAIGTLYTSLAGGQALLDLMDKLKLVLPPVIQSLLQTQLSPLAHAGKTSLGIATLVSVALVLWTTSGGVQNLVKATNIAYDVEESRNFIKLRLVSIGLSAAFIVFAAVILFLLLLQGSALHALGVPNILANLFPWLRWPLMVIVISIALSFIYRYAPNRHEPRWTWVSWGATAATLIWLVGTIAFFFYAQHFGNFNKSYGIFASIIIIMTWFNLSSLIILIGAQVNKKLEDVAS